MMPSSAVKKVTGMIASSESQLEFKHTVRYTLAARGMQASVHMSTEVACPSFIVTCNMEWNHS